MSQRLFFALLKTRPRIADLWDEEREVMKIDAFDNALGVMSSGEMHVAKFFSSVWFHNNKRHGFDLVDAMAVIGNDDRDLIISWMITPFWP